MDSTLDCLNFNSQNYHIHILINFLLLHCNQNLVVAVLGLKEEHSYCYYLMVLKWGTYLEVSYKFGSQQVVGWGADLVARYIMHLVRLKSR